MDAESLIPPPRGASVPPRRGGFTLVEVLVSTVVFVLLMGIVSSVFSQASSTIRSASAQIDASQSGRTGFDVITQRLSQATLGTYWDYHYPNNDSTKPPDRYTRRSDLHFLIAANGNSHALFFQAPEATSQNPGYQRTQGLLNACGYFVQYCNDDPNDTTHPNYQRPTHAAKSRWRYRLMQAVQPTENLAVFTDAASSGWTAAVKNTAWPIADNVIALVAWPRLTAAEETAGGQPAGTQLTPNYLYDSRNGTATQLAQLPPMVQVTMVLIDETSAVRMDSGATPPTAIENALAGKFKDCSVAQYTKDLSDLQAALNTARVRYTTLNTGVTLRESKWSSTP